MRSRATRMLLVVLLVLTTLVPASVASADGPTRQPFTNEDFTVPASYCGFPVAVHWEYNQMTLKNYGTKAGGNVTLFVTLTGALVGRLTNIETDKSVVRTFSGEAELTVYSDGSFQIVNNGVGIYPFAAFTGSQVPGYPPIFLGSGHSVARLDASGNFLDFTLSGRVEDLCAALAS